MSHATVWDNVRVALPLWPDPTELDEINLDFAATTPALVAAVHAVEEAIPWYGSLHRGGGRKSAYSTTLFEEARASVARFVCCDDASDVVFTRNTTEAANLLAAALPAGTRVLCSPFEHHANLLPWRQHRVTHLPFTPTAAALVEAAAAALEEAERAGDPFSLVAISGASNVTGEVPPVADDRPAGPRRGARSSSSTPRSWRRIARSTCASSGPTSWPSPATRSTRRSAPARSSRRATGSPTARRSCTGAARSGSSRWTRSPGLRRRAGTRPGRRTCSVPSRSARPATP